MRSPSHAVSIAATRLYHTPAVSRGGHGRDLQELVHVGNLGGTGASEAATARSGSAPRPGGSPSSDGESWRESEAMGTERFLNSYHHASTPPGLTSRPSSPTSCSPWTWSLSRMRRTSSG